MAGESTPSTPPTSETPEAPAAPEGKKGGEAPSDPPMITMTQEEYNARLAHHKRKLAKEAEDNKKAVNTLKSQMDELLKGRSIDEIREEIEETQTALKSAEERHAEEQERANNRLGEAEKARDEAISRYETATVDRAIIDEASGKATSPAAANLIRKELADRATVAEDGTVTVKMMVEKDGVKAPAQVSVAEAVSMLEADVSNWGPAFKSTVNGGAGGEVVDGVRRTASGNPDFESMTMEQFIEIQNKNPGFFDQAFSG